MDISKKTAAWILIAGLFAAEATAQSPQRSEDQIFSFEIHGINGAMTPEAARDVLLGAGFTGDRGSADDWGKVPTANFKKGDTTVAISHFEGRIYGLTELRTFTGELLDYTPYLERIREHFEIADDDPACVVRDYGTRCGIGDGQPKGARFIASLTEQMISIQLGKSR